MSEPATENGAAEEQPSQAATVIHLPARQHGPLDDATFDAICVLIATGEPARAALVAHGVNPLYFYRALNDEDSPVPDVAAVGLRRVKQYERAKDAAVRAMADDLRALARMTLSATDNVQVNAARLCIDTEKWLLSKIAPRKYGDRIELDHSGAVTLTLTPEDASL